MGIRIFSFILFLLIFSFVNGNNPDFPATKKNENISGKLYLTEADSVPLDSAKKTSKFDEFNKKAEKYFKYIPVPIVSYNPEAGNILGLAKFNTFRLDSRDTLSGYSKISEVVTFSTKGHINISAATSLSFSQDKNMIMGYVNFKKTPEYIFGIGSDVRVDDVETITIQRIKFVNIYLRKLISDFYLGFGIDLTNTFDIKKDSTSFLITEDITGADGGLNVGAGVSAAWDSRDNRYNAREGSYVFMNYLIYPNFADQGFFFQKIAFDSRKYLNPWYKHTVALQFAADYAMDDVPFYELPKLGGEDRMRGYYQGALRDKVLMDCQVEYRLPIWNIFGIAGWVGTGLVAESFNKIDLNKLWPSYGIGLRVRVDSESDINLRVDVGFGKKGINGLYINFGEAF
jgi:outer membrane protein assembly factor BamA